MSATDLDRLAAEHVMGLLEGEEARTAEKLLALDQGFAALVEDWRRRLGELDDTALPSPPGATLWSRIDASLAAPEPRPAAAAPDGRRVRISRLWNDLRFWRGAGLASAFAALVLAVGLGVSLREGARKPVLVAVLLTEANRAAAVVNSFADGRVELVPLERIDVPPGRALQVWTLWDRATGPVPVGLMDRIRPLDLATSHLPRPAPDQLFEITLEPASGSPTGRPTGPVLMKGTTSTPL